MTASWIPKIVAVILVAFTAWMARIPDVPTAEVDELVHKFKFANRSMNDVNPDDVKNAAPLLAPRFQHLESYLTAFLPTGAAIADLDGNGYPDEACTTDGFSRRIRVQTVPGKNGPSIAFELTMPPSSYGEKGVLPTGCLPNDYNNDGLIDLLVYFWGRTPVIFLNMKGELTPENFQRVEVVNPPGRWYTQSMSSGDVDGDGDLDLVVGNYFPDDAKILDDTSKGSSPMNKGLGAATNGAYNRLLLASQDSANAPCFEELAGAFKDPSLGGPQWTIATAVTDLDGDLLPEVFFLNDHGSDRVLYNRTHNGEVHFEVLKNNRDFFTPKSNTFGRDGYHAMGVDFADLNRDGHLDWAISNFGADYLFHQSHFAWINTGDNELYRKGQAPFRDMSESLGLSRTSGVPWDIRFADFNNDGSLEVYRSIGFMRGKVNRMNEAVEDYLMNDFVFQFPEAWHNWGPDDSFVGEEKPNSFFVMTKEGRYTDIGRELKMLEPACSRGMSTADVDGDGRIDFLVTNQRASSTFYKNESPAGQFLGLDIRLTLTPSDPDAIVVTPAHRPTGRKSRPAVGAAVKLMLPNGDVVAANVDGGSGFGGKKNPAIHIGLGDHKLPDRLNLEVHWRDSNGRTHKKNVKVGLGWQTLLLGSMPEIAEVQQ